MDVPDFLINIWPIHNENQEVINHLFLRLTRKATGLGSKGSYGQGSLWCITTFINIISSLQAHRSGSWENDNSKSAWPFLEDLLSPAFAATPAGAAMDSPESLHRADDQIANQIQIVSSALSRDPFLFALPTVCHYLAPFNPCVHCTLQTAPISALFPPLLWACNCFLKTTSNFDPFTDSNNAPFSQIRYSCQAGLTQYLRIKNQKETRYHCGPAMSKKLWHTTWLRLFIPCSLSIIPTPTFLHTLVFEITHLDHSFLPMPAFFPISCPCHAGPRRSLLPLPHLL